MTNQFLFQNGCSASHNNIINVYSIQLHVSHIEREKKYIQSKQKDPIRVNAIYSIFIFIDQTFTQNKNEKKYSTKFRHSIIILFLFCLANFIWILNSVFFKQNNKKKTKTITASKWITIIMNQCLLWWIHLINVGFLLPFIFNWKVV